MSQGKAAKTTQTDPSLWSAMAQVISGLKGQPVFLFATGALIVLLAAGALAIDSLRLVLIGVLVIFIAALVVWLVSRTQQVQKSHRSSTGPLSTGNVKLDKKVAGDQVNVKSGTIQDREGKDLSAGAHTGDVTVDGEINSGGTVYIGSGDILLGPPDDE